jgi:hypothetical protein
MIGLGPPGVYFIIALKIKIKTFKDAENVFLNFKGQGPLKCQINPKGP